MILTAAYWIINFFGITSRKVRKFLQIIVQLRLSLQAIHVKIKLSKKMNESESKEIYQE